MPKSVAAEWFLRLFTTPDRASALAGDMSEEGRVSWFDVLRTAAALFFRSVAEAPVRLVLLLLLGVFVNLVCNNLASLPLRPMRQNFQGSEYWWMFGLYFYGVVQDLVAPALTGYALVRLAKGRDITACVAYAIMRTVLPLYFMISHAGAEMKAGRSGWEAAGSLVFRLAFPALVLLASGALTRKRLLRQEMARAR
jgi:hypothetical protein